MSARSTNEACIRMRGTRRFAAPRPGRFRTVAGRLWLLALLLLLIGPASAAASEDTNIFKIGADVTVEEGKTIQGVFVIGGQVTVSGTVEKSVTALGGSVVLTKTAVVRGNVASLGGVIVIARDAEVGGDLTEINSSNLYETLATALSAEWEGWSWIFAAISIAIFVVLLVLATLIAALLPKPVRVVSEAIRENTFKVVLCGILALVLIAPLALLLTISVIGIALIPLQIIIVVCSGLLGFIAVSRVTGAAVLSLLHRPPRGLVRETFWGLLIVWIVGWLPYIGWMVKAVAIVIGLGATLVTRFGTYQGWKQVCAVPDTRPGASPAPAVQPDPAPLPDTQPAAPAVPAVRPEPPTPELRPEAAPLPDILPDPPPVPAVRPDAGAPPPAADAPGEAGNGRDPAIPGQPPPRRGAEPEAGQS